MVKYILIGFAVLLLGYWVYTAMNPAEKLSPTAGTPSGANPAAALLPQMFGRNAPPFWKHT